MELHIVMSDTLAWILTVTVVIATALAVVQFFQQRRMEKINRRILALKERDA